jgi:hypothetical protein
MGEPPLFAGGDHETVSALVPDTTTTFVGAFGGVDVSTLSDALDATEVPTAFVAVTWKV